MIDGRDRGICDRFFSRGICDRCGEIERFVIGSAVVEEICDRCGEVEKFVIGSAVVEEIVIGGEIEGFVIDGREEGFVIDGREEGFVIDGEIEQFVIDGREEGFVIDGEIEQFVIKIKKPYDKNHRAYNYCRLFSTNSLFTSVALLLLYISRSTPIAISRTRHSTSLDLNFIFVSKSFRTDIDAISIHLSPLLTSMPIVLIE